MEHDVKKLQAEFKKNKVVGFSHNVTTGKSHWHLKFEDKTVQVEYNPKNDPERIVNDFNIAIIDDTAIVYEDYYLTNDAYWTLFVKAFQKALSKRMHKAMIDKSKRGQLVGVATKNLKDSITKKYGKINFGNYSEKDMEVLTRMKKEYNTPVPRYF